MCQKFSEAVSRNRCLHDFIDQLDAEAFPRNARAEFVVIGKIVGQRLEPADSVERRA
jgi:hypothetical protein